MSCGTRHEGDGLRATALASLMPRQMHVHPCPRFINTVDLPHRMQAPMGVLAAGAFDATPGPGWSEGVRVAEPWAAPSARVQGGGVLRWGGTAR